MGVTGVMEVLKDFTKLFYRAGDSVVADDPKRYTALLPCSLEVTSSNLLDAWYTAPEHHGFFTGLDLGRREVHPVYTQKQKIRSEKPATNISYRDIQNIVEHYKGESITSERPKVPLNSQGNRNAYGSPTPRYSRIRCYPSKISEVQVCARPQHSRNSSSKGSRGYRQYTGNYSRSSKPLDEIIPKAKASDRLCIKDTKDGIGPDLLENHARIPGSTSELGLSPMGVGSGDVSYLSQPENAALGGAPEPQPSSTETKFEEMSYLCEQGGAIPESSFELALSSMETLEEKYLSGERDDTPRTTLELELSTIEMTAEETASVEESYFSQEEELTSGSVSSSKTDSTEYESDTSSDDACQGMLHTVRQMVLGQMLSESLRNIDLSASTYFREVPGGTGGSGSRDTQKSTGSSMSKSKSAVLQGRVTKRGKGGKENGGGKKRQSDQGKKPQNLQKMMMPCPYYLADPNNEIYKDGKSHEQCRKPLPRIRQHIYRIHLKPSQCETCGYRSDCGQVEEHRKTGKCVAPKDGIQMIDTGTLEKYTELSKRRNPSLSEIFEILFPDLFIQLDVQKYCDLEQAYPMLSEAFTHFMAPLLPVIIKNFCKSAEFKHFHENNPSVDQKLIYSDSEISDFVALEFERNITAMLATHSAIPQQQPVSQDLDIDLAPETPTFCRSIQRSHSGLRSGNQTSESCQPFPQPGAHVGPTEIQRYKTIPSPPQLELPSSPGPSFSTSPDKIPLQLGSPTANELINYLRASQEEVLEPTTDYQETPIPYYGNSQYTSSRVSWIGGPSQPTIPQHDTDTSLNPGPVGLITTSESDDLGLKSHWLNIQKNTTQNSRGAIIPCPPQQYPGTQPTNHDQPNIFSGILGYPSPNSSESLLPLDSTENSFWNVEGMGPAQEEFTNNELLNGLHLPYGDVGSATRSISIDYTHWGVFPNLGKREET